MTEDTTVYVVDDDEAIRESLSGLLESVGHRVTAFADARAFLEGYEPGRAECLLLDIRLPGMSGVDLQQRLARSDPDLPIIFVTGHGDITTAVRAMREGAVDFIEKPFSDQVLLERLEHALEVGRRSRSRQSRRAEARDRALGLSPREREVMALVAEGKPNKLIAHELGIAEKTVEAHRAHVMRKLGVRSLAELVRLQLLLEETDAPETPQRNGNR